MVEGLAERYALEGDFLNFCKAVVGPRRSERRERAHSRSAKILLRAHAAREPAAPPQNRRRIAEVDAVIRALGSDSEVLNSHTAGGSVMNFVYLADPCGFQILSRAEAILEHDSEMIAGGKPFSDIAASSREVADGQVDQLCRGFFG